MGDLGTLSPVDVRRVWEDESRDFTPWLAENADKLGEALGMDLIHEQTEAAVGQYRADLVFREASTDRLVVVENMFGRTDHDHLGKLITYAAGLEASYAVLLSPEFREEHRSALNWLNSISADDFGFFGVVLKVWRIGESPCAPQLVAEVKPDNWGRSVRAAGESSERERTYRRFWGEFLPAFRNRYPDWIRPTSPSRRHWMSFQSSRPRLLNFNPVFCRPDRRMYRLRAEAYIDTGNAETTKAVFDALHHRKQRIEEAVGESLEWDRIDDSRASRISLYFPEEIQVTDEERWPKARDWLIEAMGKMRNAFNPVIQDPEFHMQRGEIRSGNVADPPRAV